MPPPLRGKENRGPFPRQSNPSWDNLSFARFVGECGRHRYIVRSEVVQSDLLAASIDGDNHQTCRISGAKSYGSQAGHRAAACPSIGPGRGSPHRALSAAEAFAVSALPAADRRLCRVVAGRLPRGLYRRRERHTRCSSRPARPHRPQQCSRSAILRTDRFDRVRFSNDMELSVEARDVTLQEEAGGQQVALTQSVRFIIEPLALLSGRFSVREVVSEGINLDATVLPKGKPLDLSAGGSTRCRRGLPMRFWRTRSLAGLHRARWPRSHAARRSRNRLDQREWKAAHHFDRRHRAGTRRRRFAFDLRRGVGQWPADGAHGPHDQCQRSGGSSDHARRRRAGDAFPLAAFQFG